MIIQLDARELRQCVRIWIEMHFVAEQVEDSWEIEDVAVPDAAEARVVLRATEPA